MKQFDIVYALGSGSQWFDNELRFSLRAIEKNLKDVRNIVIVGQLPAFIDPQKVIFIPADDPLQSNADGNIALKVMKACNDPRVSEDFLFINDDHIINTKISVSDIGFYHKGNMESFPSDFWHNGLHRQRMRRTFEILRSKGYSTFYFDIHTPIIINKEKFKQTLSLFDFKFDIGYGMKSLYGNVAVPNDKKEFVGDRKKKLFKFKKLEELEKLQDVFESYPFISYNDQGLNGVLKYVLYNKFPKMSQFEIYPPEKEPVVKIIEYLHQSEKDYWQGVKLYAENGKNSNLKVVFRRKETERTREKLMYKLKLLCDN